jgi:long-chain-fatty-acid--[acyl-carrier-protein] ligase
VYKRQTECSPVVSVNDERDPRPYTIGKVLPSLQHMLVDPETGQRVGQGRPGMLLLRGPSIFGGYLNYDGASPFVEMDGHKWYRTGDLVMQDHEGILTFSGRLKRFAKIGGEMISLPAIEELLVQRFGDPDAEGPVLAVECTPDDARPELILFAVASIERDAANQVLREGGLSPLHHIRAVRRVESIPTLGTGKTDYRALREMLRTG